jgi:hypothetical protein
MSEIDTYPDECGHRQERERCWQCLTTENAVLSDALRVEKELVAEMGRVLLDLEWSGEDNGEYCPSCGGYQPTAIEPGYEKIVGSQIGHTEDCALDAILAKSGARTVPNERLGEDT